MTKPKSFSLDEDIIELIREDAKSDHAACGNLSVIVRRILGEHYRERLAERKERLQTA